MTGKLAPACGWENGKGFRLSELQKQGEHLYRKKEEESYSVNSLVIISIQLTA